MSIINSVRNSDGIWINTQEFRKEATRFKKTGSYCMDSWGTPDWEEYWVEQRRRCRDGYSVGGSKITGDHYFYLNFCPIRKTEDASKKVSKKVTDFPDFWDGDYTYFWVREIARKGIFDCYSHSEHDKDVYNFTDEEKAKEAKRLFDNLYLDVKIKVDYLYGGWNLIVGKARRKGFSYKNAAIAVNNYITRPGSMTILGAYEKKYLYPKGLFTMAFSYINFLNSNTGWIYPRDYIDQPGKGHIRASTKIYREGVPTETGFMSEIYSATYKDDPDSTRGKDAYDIILEESGAFGTPGLLKDVIKANKDTVKDGDIKTGMITVFGTSGDMEGGTADYADMHKNPISNGFLPFDNIWDEDSEDFECGYFHPIQQNMPGYYDKQGNSDKEAARKAEENERKFLLSHGATSSDIVGRMQENPLGPQEAFGSVSFNNFPTLEIEKQKNIVLNRKLHLKKGQPVKMYYSSKEKRVVAEPILDGSENVVHRYKPDNISLEGCPVIYEQPAKHAPRNAYKIGYDPYRQDQGTSLSSIIVYKPVIQGESTKNIIVAEYVGRPEEADDVTYIAKLFSMYYNTEIMYENEVTHVRDYFKHRRELHFLAQQPDTVIAKNTKNSKTSRTYGCHMNTQMKDAGEKYIKSWLLEVVDYDENGNPIRALDRIYSIGLLEELLKYDRKGNFDRVMALMQVMFQDKEEEYDKEHTKEDKNKEKIRKLYDMESNRVPSRRRKAF